MTKHQGLFSVADICAQIKAKLPYKVWQDGILIDSYAFGLAQFIATSVFAAVIRDNGLPYITHLSEVASKHHHDLSKQAIAWLHDIIEDSEWTADDLRQVGFSDRIVDGVVALTRQQGRNGKEPYFDFIERCSNNADACEIKLDDLESNSLIARNPFFTSAEKLLRYQIAYQYLVAVRTQSIVSGSPITEFVRSKPDLYRKARIRKICQEASSRPWPTSLEIGQMPKG